MSHIGSAQGGGGNTPTYLVLQYTLVNTTPYTVLSSDSFLGVDASIQPIIIKLPNAPVTGRVYVIKDITGSAYTNNIVLTTVGGVVDIDGLTSFIMNAAFESVQILFNGTEYLIF